MGYHSFQKLRPKNRTRFLVAKSCPLFVMQTMSCMVGRGRTLSDAQARSWCAPASVSARKRQRRREQRMSTCGHTRTHTRACSQPARTCAAQATHATAPSLLSHDFPWRPWKAGRVPLFHKSTAGTNRLDIYEIGTTRWTTRCPCAPVFSAMKGRRSENN